MYRPRNLSLSAATAVTALLVLCTAAFALPPAHTAGALDPNARLEARLAGLDLDDPTRDAIYTILDRSRVDVRVLRQNVVDAHAGLRALLDQDTPGEAVVLGQVELVGELMTELRKQQLSTMLAVRAHLTPEQRDELRASSGMGSRTSGAAGRCAQR